MKGLKFPILLAGVLLASAAVPLAQGTTNESTQTIRRIAALERKMRAVQASVTRLNADMACLKFRAAPVAAYGDPPAEGFVYSAENGARVFTTTALDIADEGDTPDLIVPAINPECVATRAAQGRPAGRTSSRVKLLRYVR